MRCSISIEFGWRCIFVMRGSSAVDGRRLSAKWVAERRHSYLMDANDFRC